MQLIITPVSGGQPVVLGFGSGTSQGALNVAKVATTITPTDLLLIVRAGILTAVSWATILSSLPTGGTTGGGGSATNGFDFSQISLALLPGAL